MRSRTSSLLGMQPGAGEQTGGASTLGLGWVLTLLTAILVLVIAISFTIFVVIHRDSDREASSPTAGPSPEDVARIYIRAVETGDLATVKKVTCTADTAGITSTDPLRWGPDVSMTVAGKAFEADGRTRVPLKANGRTPDMLGGQPLHDDDGGALTMTKTPGGWQVCYVSVMEAESAKKGQSPRSDDRGIDWHFTS